jgi:glycosyltransferase involved in cell wall biosynthesis
MTGKMSYHANATAAIRLVEDVMPRVWATRPGARLLIVGKDPPREVVRLQDAGDGAGGVVVTGTVEDIRPFLRTATIAVAPIRYGVGIQNKVLEALACGTPVVATPQATSALDITDGRDLVVGRDPGELANAIGALLGDADRRRRIGEAGRAYVERHHSWRAAAVRLTDIYHDAIA